MKLLFALLLLPLAAFGATTLAPGTYTVPSCPVTPPVICTPPQVMTNGVCAPPIVTTPPATGTYWVYHNGVFSWPGDYSFVATINYKDTAGAPLSGPYDVAIKVTSQWGAWQPFAFGATGSAFDTSKYKYLIYSIKTTVAGQVIATGFDANNDVKDGNIVVVAGPGITKYGPVPVVGQWGSYKIPITDFGLTNPLILKFTVADGSGSTAMIYANDVGFSP